jgi:hypothetical protein
MVGSLDFPQECAVLLNCQRRSVVTTVVIPTSEQLHVVGNAEQLHQTAPIGHTKLQCIERRYIRRNQTDNKHSTASNALRYTRLILYFNFMIFKLGP